MNREVFHEAQVRIPTPEQVFLEYPLAGVARRALATLLDSIVIFAGALVLVLLTALLIVSISAALKEDIAPWMESWLLALFIAYSVLLLVAPLFYFGIYEYYWNGQTPGKRAAGIRVIRANGLALDRTSAALRNLFRIVDLLPSSYLVGIWSVMLSGRQQRIGDLVAGTIVIALPKRRALAAIAEGTASFSTGAQLMFEGRRAERERWMLEQYLRRRGEFEPAARIRIARMLAGRHGITLAQATVQLEQQLYERFTSL